MKKNLLLILIFISLGAMAQIPTAGLVAYYPFNGNANDASGNGNNATVNGASLVADRNGNANSAYSFDGIDDNILTSLSFPTGSNPKSFSCWVKFNNLNDRGWVIGNNVFCLSGAFNSAFGLFSEGGAARRILFHGHGASSDIPLKTILADNVYYNFTVSYDGSVTRCWVNGVLDSSKVFTLTTGNNPILFGSRTPVFNPSCPEEYFNGIIDDVAIYNRALTPQEAQQIYTLNAGSAIPTLSQWGLILFGALMLMVVFMFIKR